MGAVMGTQIVPILKQRYEAVKPGNEQSIESRP
jgi:hypothetical protein